MSVALSPQSSLPAEAGTSEIAQRVGRRQVPQAAGLYDLWVQLPSTPVLPEAPAPPRLQAMVRESMDWTGWSTRDVAALLSVSHTTVQHWAAGRLPRSMRGRNVLAFEALDGIHRVLERVRVLAGADRPMLGGLLKTASPDAAASPYALLQRRDFAGAYLAALDVLRPVRPTGLLVGNRPAPAGRSVSSLHDGQ